MRHYGLDIHNGKALCCFHNDNTPSLSVDEKKQIAKCFSCGTGGNAISFVQKYEKEINNNPISLSDAIVKVVEICGLDINVSHIKNRNLNYQYTTTARKYSEEERKLLETNKFLSDLFSYNLTVVKDEGLSYLHERGLSDDLIEEMKLGFAVKGQLLKSSENAKEDSKLNVNQLRELGLIRLDGLNMYEVFEDRIIFPITDEKGNIVTFAGRAIHDEKPKYLHTSETSIFHKKELLYNYSNAKTYSYNDELILTEGYMDVIGAKQKGFDNVVALMGLDISEEHIKLLKKNNCSITLALDNDYEKEENTGRNAIIKAIPKLLEEGFKVDVIDISKLGNYKDFGDLGKSDLSREEILKAKVSSFTFMMDYYYFKNRELNVETIHSIFDIAKKDNFLISTLDESKYKEYILERTTLSKEELEEILYPKNLSSKVNPFTNLQAIAMEEFVKNSIESDLQKRNDKVLSGYYELNKKELDNKALKLFNENPSAYLSKNAMKLNTALLLLNVLNEDTRYSEYETLHSFKYEDIFEKTYIKNVNGTAKVNLSFEQKQAIINQYENSLTDKERLSLEEVEELYIINDTSDLDGILNHDNATMKTFKENIQDRMFLHKDDMQFFKYGNLFLNIDKEFISSEFKGKTGNFKTILFFNNLDGKIKLDKEQLTKEQVPIIQNEIELDKKEDIIEKDFIFSINQILLVPSKETDTHYFIRIPNTNMKDYFYLPKSECNWSSNKEMLFTKLKSGMKYKIYTRNGEYKEDKTTEELRSYWEDKTKQKVFESKVKEPLNETESKETKPTLSSKPYIPEKEPVCKVFKTKIIDTTDNGYYFKLNSDDLFFVTKKICTWNQDGSYLIMKPKKNRITGTGISRYELKGDTKKFVERISFNDLEKYFHFFYPATYKKNPKQIIEISKDNCNVTNNFLTIPITLDNVYGYIRVSTTRCTEDKENIKIELSKNEQLSFYSKEGTYMGHYSYSDIQKGLTKEENKIIPLKNKKTFDFNDLFSSYKEVTYYSGEDVLEFIPTTIEPTYECFETTMHIKLNGNYIYKPEGRNVGAYKNILVQEGKFESKEDVVAFLETYFKDRKLSETMSYPEREVA